jgi:hypothetical protein
MGLQDYKYDIYNYILNFIIVTVSKDYLSIYAFLVIVLISAFSLISIAPVY